MCGIVGMMGDFSDKRDTFDFLLEIDAIRGKDSTGILVVNQSDLDVQWYKDAVLPTELMSDTAYRDMVGRSWTKGKRIDPVVLMGHNRHATKGEVTSDNAHPFEAGNTFLTHNGTIHNLFPMKKHIPGEAAFDTDSETMTNAIDHAGVGTIWKDMTGAASIAFYDNNHASLNLLTNGERPLFYALGKDDKYLLYASELFMLVAAKMRFKLDIEKYCQPAMNVHHTFYYDPKEKKISVEKKKLEAYLPISTSYSGNRNPVRSWWPASSSNSAASRAGSKASDLPFTREPWNKADTEKAFSKLGKRRRKRLGRAATTVIRKLTRNAPTDRTYQNYLRLLNKLRDKSESDYNLNDPLVEALVKEQLAVMHSDAIKDVTNRREEFDNENSLSRSTDYGREPIPALTKRPYVLQRGLLVPAKPTEMIGTKKPTFSTAKNNMTEEEYRASYGHERCVWCNTQMLDEYDNAVILDADTIMCGDDAKTAEAENMQLAFINGV